MRLDRLPRLGVIPRVDGTKRAISARPGTCSVDGLAAIGCFAVWHEPSERPLAQPDLAPQSSVVNTGQHWSAVNSCLECAAS